MYKTTEKHELKSEQETKELAITIAKKINKGCIIAFSGNLGSGKTFFCTQIIKYLCGEQVRVVSPTFNLLKIYSNKNFTIYHFDLFRVLSLNEVYELGIEEAFSEDQICLIEWPEVIYNILPYDSIHIEIVAKSDNTRLVNIHK